MDHLRTNIFDEYKKEKEKADYFQKQASEWQEKYYELLNELKKTQALLRQFLNENTPSSNSYVFILKSPKLSVNNTYTLAP